MKKIRFALLALCLCTSGLFISSCSKSTDPTPAAPSLYDRIGKTDGVTKVVDAMLVNVEADCASPATSTMIRTHGPLLVAVMGGDQARLQHLRSTVIDIIVKSTDGPVAYNGKSMLQAHTGMGVTSSEFNSWIGLFGNALDKCNIASTEKNEVLTRLKNMQSDIVGH